MSLAPEEAIEEVGQFGGELVEDIDPTTRDHLGFGIRKPRDAIAAIGPNDVTLATEHERSRCHPLSERLMVDHRDGAVAGIPSRPGLEHLKDVADAHLGGKALTNHPLRWWERRVPGVVRRWWRVWWPRGPWPRVVVCRDDPEGAGVVVRVVPEDVEVRWVARPLMDELGIELGDAVVRQRVEVDVDAMAAWCGVPRPPSAVVRRVGLRYGLVVRECRGGLPVRDSHGRMRADVTRVVEEVMREAARETTVVGRKS